MSDQERSTTELVEPMRNLMSQRSQRSRPNPYERPMELTDPRKKEEKVIREKAERAQRAADRAHRKAYFHTKSEYAPGTYYNSVGYSMERRLFPALDDDPKLAARQKIFHSVAEYADKLRFTDLEVEAVAQPPEVLQLGRVLGNGTYGVVFSKRLDDSKVYKIDAEPLKGMGANEVEYGTYRHLGLTSDLGCQMAQAYITEVSGLNQFPFVKIENIFSILIPGVTNKVLAMERLDIDMSDFIASDKSDILMRDGYLNFTRISQQLIVALQFIHKEMTFHNDLKPENICFKRVIYDGLNFTEMDASTFNKSVIPHVCVIDMGMATPPTAFNMLNWSDRVQKPVGSYRFAPLDQYFNRHITQRGELESMGYVIFSMLVKLPWDYMPNPFDKETMTRTFRMKMCNLTQSIVDPRYVAPLARRYLHNQSFWGEPLTRHSAIDQGILFATTLRMHSRQLNCPKLLNVAARYFSIIYGIDTSKPAGDLTYQLLRDSLDFDTIVEFDQEAISTLGDKYEQLIEIGMEMMSYFKKINKIEGAWINKIDESKGIGQWSL